MDVVNAVQSEEFEPNVGYHVWRCAVCHRHLGEVYVYPASRARFRRKCKTCRTFRVLLLETR